MAVDKTRISVIIYPIIGEVTKSRVKHIRQLITEVLKDEKKIEILEGTSRELDPKAAGPQDQDKGNI